MSNWSPPKMVIKEIADPNILFDIAKNSDNYSHRFEAIERLTDQELLAEIAMFEREDATQEKALELITNQEILAHISINVKNDYVRMCAVERLDNQEILVEIAKSDRDSFVRREAIEKISDQQTLAYVAMNDDSNYNCEIAFEGLTDQALIADVANNALDYDIRIMAAEKLNDQAIAQEVYADIAKNGIEYFALHFPNRSIRLKAAEKISDQAVAQAVYADIIKKCENQESREEAVEKLTDQALLADVFINCNDSELRLTALNKITDQEFLAEIAKQNDAFHKYNPSCNCGACQYDGVYFRIAAARKLTDQVTLADVAKNGVYGDSRFIVVTKLTDDIVLKFVANNDADEIVRKVATERLTNHVLHDAEIQQSKIIQPYQTIQFAGSDWLVLDKVDGKTLVISEKVLTKKSYHAKSKDVSWENCELREYLNGSFYDNTFSRNEKSKIVETRNENKGNLLYGMNCGNDTLDKVFLLSLDEIVRYFGNSGQHYYGNYHGTCFISDEYNHLRKAELGFGEYFKRVFGDQYRAIESSWWIRSPFKNGNSIDGATASIVGDGGTIKVGGYVTFLAEGVRPALWLNLE